MKYGRPEQYLLRDGHCGHCGAGIACWAISEYGIFCLACYRWCVYTGPDAFWGDGMRIGWVNEQDSQEQEGAEDER